MTLVYRCISARRWLDTDDDRPHVPRVDIPPASGRWNRRDQHALYTSHEPDVAIEEKARHLDTRGRGPFGSIVRAIGAPIATEVVVLEFAMPDYVWGCFDGRTRPRADFDAALDPCSYAAAHAILDSEVPAGTIHLIVPSSPRPDSWNSVFYLGPGQLSRDDVPSRDDVRPVAQGDVLPNPPGCGS